jgi:hypothetical protein
MHGVYVAKGSWLGHDFDASTAVEISMLHDFVWYSVGKLLYVLIDTVRVSSLVYLGV